MQGFMALLVALLVLFSTLETHAAAEKSCPSHIKPNNPRVTGTKGERGNDPGKGVSLDTPIYMMAEKADGSGFFYFEVPLGYRLGWISEAPGYKFDPNEILPGWWTFWMPEKRYPEIELGYSLLTRSHGCEQGRFPPSVNEYFVTFGVQSLIPKHRRHGTPEDVWKKSFGHLGGTDDLVLDSGILTRKLGRNISSDIKSLSAPPGRVFYRNPIGHPFQFMFACSDSLKRLCDAQFYFPERNLNLQMRFTRNRLDNWQEILDASLELLNGWGIREQQLPRNTRNQSK